MAKTLAIVLLMSGLMSGLGAALGGCSNCGWIWNDGGKSHACMSDVPKR